MYMYREANIFYVMEKSKLLCLELENRRRIDPRFETMRRMLKQIIYNKLQLIVDSLASVRLPASIT